MIHLAVVIESLNCVGQLKFQFHGLGIHGRYLVGCHKIWKPLPTGGRQDLCFFVVTGVVKAARRAREKALHRTIPKREIEPALWDVNVRRPVLPHGAKFQKVGPWAAFAHRPQ
jgi:hypothetical protein